METAREIVVAGRYLFIQDALASVLSRCGNSVVGIATTRQGLIEQVARLQPHLCVTGNSFPDGEAVDVLGGLAAHSPRTKVVILTADGNADTLQRALNAGASGYVHKSRGLSALMNVLDRVDAGEVVVEGSFVRTPEPVPQAPSHLLRLATYLTQRELECLALLVDGLDTAAMSHQLGVSRTTVRSHVQSVLNKLGVHSRLEAASVAVRFGLIDAIDGGRRASVGPA